MPDTRYQRNGKASGYRWLNDKTADNALCLERPGELVQPDGSAEPSVDPAVPAPPPAAPPTAGPAMRTTQPTPPPKAPPVAVVER
ncbi:MAG: hypothetical protein KC502_22210, partial [Myxococcales bacterium]|nr:hypothetical protein [Myxococcales bacterium]